MMTSHLLFDGRLIELSNDIYAVLQESIISDENRCFGRYFVTF